MRSPSYWHQHNLLENPATRLVVPLIAACRIKRPIKNLIPEVIVEGTILYLSTSELTGIPKTLLSRAVTSLKDQRTAIVRSVKMLLSSL